MSTLENKFARLANLPTMPALLTEAIQQINSKQNLTTLVDKIAQDPSMAVRILRIVNSPFYGMSREIGSLREAIVLLGLNRIRDMLISICFSKIAPAQHKDFDYSRFWRHSMAVAESTRQLAHCAGTNPDLAFTAGLLHNIGHLVLVVLFPDEFSQLVKISATFGIEAEQQLLGFNHMILGGKAAQYWNLPVAIQEAIEQHKTAPDPDADKSLGLLVYTANLMSIKTEQSDVLILEGHDPIHSALAILNVSIDQAARCTHNGQQFADQILTLS